MKWSFSLSLCLSFVAAASARAADLAPAAGPPDPLWEKAVSLVEKADDAKIVPDKLEWNSRVKKKNGSIENESQRVYRIVDQGEEGEEGRMEILSAVENGKDVTARLRAEEAEEPRADGEEKEKREADTEGKEAARRTEEDAEETTTVSLEPGYHPFDADDQARITYRRAGDETLEGRKAAVFRFRETAESGEGFLDGRAWVDLETRFPLQVKVSPDPLPRRASSMESTVRFEVSPEGHWRPTTTEVRGEGGFLMFRRIFESSFRFLDWRPEETHGGVVAE